MELADPHGQPGCSVPDDLDLEHLFAVAVEDICDTHNALADSQEQFAALPASQRWAIDILRSPGTPAGLEYDNADMALSVGRNNIIRRQLSALRRDYSDHKLSVPDCAQGIVELVTEHGLRPVEPPTTLNPITQKKTSE